MSIILWQHFKIYNLLFNFPHCLLGFSVTTPLRCLSMNRGSQGECECPALDRCNNSQRICGQIGSRCKLFRNDCDHKAAGCRGESMYKLLILSIGGRKFSLYFSLFPTFICTLLNN